MSEKFELELEVDDSAIDRGIRKLQQYDRLVKRVSGSVRQATGTMSRAASGASGATGGAIGGLGELTGSLAGTSVVERLMQRNRDRSDMALGGRTITDRLPTTNDEVRTRSILATQNLRDRNRGVTSRAIISQTGMLGGARGFARTRGTQFAEGMARGGFRADRFGRSAMAGLSRRGGGMIGAGLGAKLGSIIPGAGTILGLSIGAGIGALADRAIGSLIERDSDVLSGREMRRQIAELSDIRLRRRDGPVAQFIQAMTTRELRERDVGMDMARRGVSGFSLFGDLFSYQGHGFIGPGWSSRDFDIAREQQARELTSRQTGGTGTRYAPGTLEMNVQLMEQQIARMTRE